jgi:hypothetical protein
MTPGAIGRSEFSPSERILHRDGSDSRRFQQLWKDYHAENKAVNTQPPTSANYLLRLYPKTLERDALLAENEIMWDFK